MEPLDLAGGGRVTGLGEQVLDPVLSADRVEQDLDRWMVEPAGEDFAVVGQDLLGLPVGGRRGAQPVADGRVRSRGITLAETQNREWSSTPVSALALVPSASAKSAHNVHLPQLHRVPTFPPFPGCASADPRASASIMPARTNARYTADSEGTGATSLGQLEREPGADPSTDASRRNSNTRPRPSAGIWCGHDRGRCDRSTSPSSPPAS